jgi:hypothetical protein
VDERVLIVSIGAFEKGPMAPDMRPMIMCWYDGSSVSSGWYLCAAFFSSWYAVKFAPIQFAFRVVSNRAVEPQTLVSGLPKGSETDAAIQRRDAFFADDGVHGMSGVTISRSLHRVCERVLLCL